MTNAYAGLGGLIIPVILILIAVGVVFMKAFQVTPQWQAYDDIYRGRYNINGIFSYYRTIIHELHTPLMI